jgi:hypothetical protein
LYVVNPEMVVEQACRIRRRGRRWTIEDETVRSTPVGVRGGTNDE